MNVVEHGSISVDWRRCIATVSQVRTLADDLAACDTTTPPTMRQLTRQFRHTGALRHGARAFSTEGEALVPSGGLHFYRNKQMEIYAAKQAHRLSLRQLVSLNSLPAMRILTSDCYTSYSLVDKWTIIA